MLSVDILMNVCLSESTRDGEEVRISPCDVDLVTKVDMISVRNIRLGSPGLHGKMPS